jgi:hypothetical protein
METWKKAIPAHLYKIREKPKEIIIEDRVKICFGGMDDESNINKFNSAEFAYAAIDQAEEISRTDLALIKGTLRLKHNDIEPNYKILLTANPAPCFLRQDYIDSPPKDGSKVFIQALPADNPYLPNTYVDTLKDAFKHRPELVEAYINGSWDQLQGADILVKHSWVTKCVEAKVHDNQDRRLTVADVAWLGDDETVIYNMVDNQIVDELIYGPKNAMVTAGNIVAMSKKNNSDMIAIDADGFGGGVYDAVGKILDDSNNKIVLLAIRSGKKADNEDDYVNSRTEMWFHAANVIAETDCSLPNDQVLIGQLSSTKYNPNGSRGRFQLERKKDTKQRLDSSPDRADAFIYGLWATSKIHKKKYDFAREQAEPIQVSDSYGWERLQEHSVSQGGY